jgi:hypothetical protein
MSFVMEDDEIRLVLLCRKVRRAQRKMLRTGSKGRCDDLERQLDEFLAEYDCDKDLRDLQPTRRTSRNHA